MRTPVALLVACSVVLPFGERIRVRTHTGVATRMEIVEVERRLASAIRERDRAALAHLVAADARIVAADGELLRGHDWFAAGGAAPELAADIPEPDVRVYDAIALVHGRARLHRAEVYVLRAWAGLNDGWRLVVDHATDITRHATADPPAFAMLPERIRAQAIHDVPDENAGEEDVKRALRESHQRYWAKDVHEYTRTVGSDLIRVAETGVRPGDELVDFMRHSPHLPRTPSDQREMWAKVVGSAAIGGWLDAGTTPHGIERRNRFTLALVWRDRRWQIVQIQSTGVSG